MELKIIAVIISFVSLIITIHFYRKTRKIVKEIRERNKKYRG